MKPPSPSNMTIGWTPYPSSGLSPKIRRHRIEQLQLETAMDAIERTINIKHDALGRQCKNASFHR
jgi:hypothetical protein